MRKEFKNCRYFAKIEVICLAVLSVSCGMQHAMNGASREVNLSASDGKTGSTARFNVMNDKLYTISGGGLAVFDVSLPENPIRSGFTSIAGDIETVFNDGKHLFIGAETALHIYSVDNPNYPSRLGVHYHVRSCDPVVTSGNIAYVTLKSDRVRCNGTTNVLKVIDVSNPKRPVEIQMLPMFRPAGLGIADKRLFVCDAQMGMAEFDLNDPRMPIPVRRVQEENCSDLIPLEKTLITTGVGGVSQYDIENGGLVFLSRIQLDKN